MSARGHNRLFLVDNLSSALPSIPDVFLCRPGRLFGADCSRLAVSDPSATVNLWDVETAQVVATYRGKVAAFSPDGTVLAVGCPASKYIGDEKLVGRVTLHYAPSLKEIDRGRSAGPQ